MRIHAPTNTLRVAIVYVVLNPLVGVAVHADDAEWAQAVVRVIGGERRAAVAQVAECTGARLTGVAAAVHAVPAVREVNE